MQFAGTDPLTLANLCLPQFARDTNRVELFVRSQQLHSTTFASEGRAQHPKTHFGENVDGLCLPSTRYQGTGFSSPILKARVDKNQNSAPTGPAVPANEPSNKFEDYHEGKKNKDNIGHSRNALTVCSGKVPNKRLVSKGRSSRKAPPRLSIEHTTRLAERRDRKRAKRAIMNSVHISESTKGESLSEDDQGGKKCKETGGKTKKVKISSELTLMQSFSATNIGRERLTLKPGPNMGVFNKGKASISMHTNARKRRARNDYTFSETKFLNHARPQAQLLHLGGSSSSSRTSNDSHATREPIKISKFFTNAPRTEHTHGKEARTGSEKPLSITEHVDKPFNVHAGAFDDDRISEIWNIELEKSLPSDDRSLLVQHQEMQNITLNTHVHKTMNNDVRPNKNPINETDISNRRCSLPRDSSPIHGQSNTSKSCAPPSLAPSHSASQVDRLSQYDFKPIESTVRQRQIVETDYECLPVPHSLPSFRFRPMESSNQVLNFSAESAPSDPACEMDDSDAQTRLNMLILNHDVNDGRIFNESCRWNMKATYHAVEDSRDLVTTANFHNYEDMEGCCWQDECNPESELPHEHHQKYKTTTDHMQQHILKTYESYLEDCDGLDTVSNEGPECHSSLCPEEWSHIPLDDDSGHLRSDILMNHSVDNWSDLDGLDHNVVSPLESPRYVQRGSDMTPSAFLQGRSLLFGVEQPTLHNEGDVLWTIKKVEHEVAIKLLKDHWLPQKL